MTPGMRSLFIAAAVAVFLCFPAEARPWPDSSERIVVFSDQLPEGMTEAQRQFAATNLAGTQKMRRDEIRGIRAYNTNFLCVHYQLALGNGSADFIDGNAWTSDWWAVTTKSNWFLLNPSAQRVYQTEWHWYVMNITYSNGTANTAYPNYWYTTCLARIRSAEDDGVFADSFTVDGYGFGQCSPTHPWLEDIDLCKSNWIPGMEAFATFVRTNFEAEGSGYLFLPNLGGLITGWDPTDYGVGHGGMIECFCFWPGATPFDTVDDWRLQMERGMALVRSNKIVICQSYCDTLDYTGRMFATTAYLLIKGSRTYLNLLTVGEVLEYYPEYTILLGPPSNSVPTRLSNLWHQAWGVYRRPYMHGVVLVNPSGTTVRISNLGTNYVRIQPLGGGEVDEFGDYGGSLSYSVVTTLTMAAYSGAVLLYPNGDCDGDRFINYHEYRAGTDSMNAGSLLRMADCRMPIADWRAISWSSVTNKSYRLERSSLLVTDHWSLVTGSVTGLPPLNTVTDKTASGAGPWTYRVELE